jgi:UPF0716 protein FxsA
VRALLIFVFIVVPLVELAIIIQVGELIGLGPTIVALLGISVLGAWLVRREGTRAWRNFRLALASGRVPADEVLVGALVLFGGALLLTPGFATDALGLLLMIPPARKAIAAVIKRQLGTRFTVTTLTGGGYGRRSDDVVDVEVVNVERDAAARNGDINRRLMGCAGRDPQA